MNLYRVISEKHGLLWTGYVSQEEAEHIAIVAAVNTGTVYLQEGTIR